MRLSSPFMSAGVLRRAGDVESATFMSRQFAANRAGFLLREYAKQQEEISLEGFSMGGDDAPEMAVFEAATPVELDTAPASVGGVSAEETERLVREAEQRGREQALSEMAGALDQAISSLDAAAQALLAKDAELERQMIVPLAQASVQIAAQIARQTLATPEGLERYIESVLKTLTDGDASATADVVVRLHPEDLALLERGSAKPQHLRLQGDEAVSRGGVLIGGEQNAIDDRLENRIREVREAALAAAAELLRESRA
ncbi:MAG: hypothetical protein EBR51_04790 [Gammaproteobacteria bacterium]|nr:hypothetical protein [Gammaproteobacteria bacterium]